MTLATKPTPKPFVPQVLKLQPDLEKRAMEIKQTLGLTRAAGFLRDRGVSEDVARRILLSGTTQHQ